MAKARRLLVLLLRLFGGSTVCALPAIVMPTDWMDAAHAWLGLGPLPRAPIVEYLARSAAALYAVNGGAILVCSRDVIRYGPLIAYLAIADGVFGIVVTGIDLHAGLPWFWTALEGPAVILPVVVILVLQARIRAADPAERRSAHARIPNRPPA